MIPEQKVTLQATDGVSLEAQIAVPPGAAAGIAICHPHPLYGGDMDNPVVVRTAEVAFALGLATCRFNFRGVGASSGTHDEGRAEQRDAEAALDHLEAAVGPGRRLLLAGYSFGAVVSARVAERRRLAGLVLIAPPVGMTGERPFTPLAERDVPVLVVAGDRDEYAPEPALRLLAERLPKASVVTIEGANHFYFGKLYPLGETLRGFLEALEARQAGRGGGPA